MDDKIVKKTQETLGKIIKKPPLTEKLLKKPPFRFLHDILTSVRSDQSSFISHVSVVAGRECFFLSQA
jgi:hypothetical protein